MERLLTTEDVADLLRIEPVTVRRLVTRGELVASRIAGEYRFTTTNVERFVESQQIMVKASPKDQFAKFTPRARKVLSIANEEAHQYNHGGIGTEHIVLGIMREGEGIAAIVLQDLLQVQESDIRKQIEELHPVGEEVEDTDPTGMTSQGKESIDLAIEEAHLFNHHYIGTEHLLLGLLREEEGIAGRVLRNVGITLEETRSHVKQLLATKQPNRVKQMIAKRPGKNTPEAKQDDV